MIPLHDDNPTKTIPVVTVSIIVAATAIFFYQLSLGPQAEQRFVYQYGGSRPFSSVRKHCRAGSSHSRPPSA
jgi:membrane associated rhomboid family serine protease